MYVSTSCCGLLLENYNVLSYSERNQFWVLRTAFGELWHLVMQRVKPVLGDLDCFWGVVTPCHATSETSSGWFGLLLGSCDTLSCYEWNQFWVIWTVSGERRHVRYVIQIAEPILGIVDCFFGKLCTYITYVIQQVEPVPGAVACVWGYAISCHTVSQTSSGCCEMLLGN
jgi:hypothetical protein